LLKPPTAETYLVASLPGAARFKLAAAGAAFAEASGSLRPSQPPEEHE